MSKESYVIQAADRNRGQRNPRIQEVYKGRKGKLDKGTLEELKVCVVQTGRHENRGSLLSHAVRNGSLSSGLIASAVRALLRSIPPSASVSTLTASAGGVSGRDECTNCLYSASETTDSTFCRAAALTAGSRSVAADLAVASFVVVSVWVVSEASPAGVAAGWVLPMVAAMARLMAFETGSESVSVSISGAVEEAWAMASRAIETAIE